MATGRKPTESLTSIQSVRRAAAILDLFSPSQPRWSLPQITKRLSASRATVHRYLMALRTVGLLAYDEHAGIYTLGPEVLRLGAAALAGLPVVDVSGPYLWQLAQDTGETVVLSVWDGEAPVIVRVEHAADRVVHIEIRTGARLPAATSAQGRVFLAHLDGWAEAGLPSTDRKTVIEAGLAMSTEIEPGIRAVAAPIFGADGISAVVALVGTEASLPGSIRSIQSISLVDTAKQISETIGYLERTTETKER